MNWSWAMLRALDFTQRTGERTRVYGVRVVDQAGLVDPCWIYRVEVVR